MSKIWIAVAAVAIGAALLRWAYIEFAYYCLHSTYKG